LIDKNPCAKIPRIKEYARDRVLTDDELASTWRAAGELDLYGRAIRMLILTGARKSEVERMRRGEIFLDQKLWKLAGGKSLRTKTRQAHTVPLSDAAIALIEGTGEREFKANLINDRMKKRLDAISGVKDYHVHDFRHTMATTLAERYRVAPHVIDMLLGHKRAGVSAVYNQAIYLDDMREALDAWARHVLGLVAGAEAQKAA
jgi:integrase